MIRKSFTSYQYKGWNEIFFIALSCIQLLLILVLIFSVCSKAKINVPIPKNLTKVAKYLHIYSVNLYYEQIHGYSLLLFLQKLAGRNNRYFNLNWHIWKTHKVR